MCKSLPAYGSKMETEGPSATLIIKKLVHAATMHTDATVLRVGDGGGCGARESGTAFSSHCVRLVVPRETGSIFPCKMIADDDESGVENMKQAGASSTCGSTNNRHIWGSGPAGITRTKHISKHRRGDVVQVRHTTLSVNETLRLAVRMREPRFTIT